MNMFTPRGYTAVPQEAASQDEDESVDKNSLSQSFDQRKNWSASRNTEAMHSTSRTSREGETEEGETKERRVKRNVRFESRSLEERPEPLSNARRLCFVVSLMICTLTIFVFAFTVPCKGPSCNVANMITTVTSNLEEFHKNWSMTFPAYSTGIVFHLSSFKTREVVVSFNRKRAITKHWDKVSKDEIHKTTGKQKKWSTKESGLISLKEDNGEFLWLFNASDVVKLIECRTDDNDFETCLIQSSHGRLQLINPKRNQIIWSTRILIGSILPSIIIGINDCDGDDGRDILLSYDRFNTTCMSPTNKTFCTHPGVVQLISGRTGYPLGSRLNIPQSHLIKRVSIHSTRHAENLIFVLTVGNKGHLKVISIQELYRKILEGRVSDSTYLFNNSTLSVSDIVSTDHQPVVKDLNKDFVDDIILVTLAGNKHSLTAVDGGKLKKMWRIAFGSRKMLSQPVIGHFNDDEIPDILVILEDPVLSFFNQSLVQILDGQNGNILWTRKLRLAKDTAPLTAKVGYKSNVFLLWIEKESKRKYKKIFLSKAGRESSNDIGKQVIGGKSKSKAGIHGKRETQLATSVKITRHALQKNVSENSIAQDVGHRRSPRSIKSREKEASVIDMADELDSLVDEIFVKDNENIPRPKSIDRPHKNGKKSESTHKMLEDILKKEGQPLEVVKKEYGSRIGEAKATISTRLIKQGPKLFRQMMRNSGANAGKSTPMIVTLATLRPTVHNVNTFHSKPNIRKEKLQSVFNHLMKTASPSIILTSQQPERIVDHREMTDIPSTEILNRKSIARQINGKTGKRIIIGRQRIPATKKSSLNLSNKERVQELIPGSSSYGENDGMIKPTTGNHVHETATSTNRQSLNRPSEISEKPLTEGQKFRKVIISRVDSKIDDDEETTSSTFLTTQPESHVSMKTTRNNPTTNGGGIEHVIMQNSVRRVGDHRGGNDEQERQSSTTILPTHGIDGKIQIIETKPTATGENGGRLGHVGIQKSLRGNSNSNNQSNDVSLPISNSADQLHNKAVSGKATIHNIHQIGNDVLLAIHPVTSPGQSPKTASIKTKNPVPHIQSQHQNDVKVEKMADLKSKDTGNRMRAGKDIIILPTKIPTTEQMLSEKKRQRQINRETTQTVPQHQNQRNRGNRTLKVDYVHGASSVTTVSSSHDVNENSGTTNKLERRRKHLNKTNHDQNIVNKLIKTNISSSPHSLTDNKVKLPNGGNKEDIFGNNEKTHHKNSVELNRTGHPYENKMTRVTEKTLKLIPSGMPKKQQPSNTSKSHEPKASEHQILLHQTAMNHDHSSDGKKKHDIRCPDGFNLALIAIFPNSPKNSFSIVSQENNIKKPKGSSAPCDTLWPTLNTSPLVHDADSDGFLEIVYAVNYGHVVQNARMKVRKFSLKVGSEE